MQSMSYSKSEADEALEKAKIHLMCKSGSMFFSSISMSLTHLFNPTISTARTNGKSVEYNPEFFLGLDSEERVGLIYHEAAHVAFMHMFRCGERDHRIWNYAADYVINILGTDSGFKIPKMGLHDEMFREWSSDQVYDYLYENRIKLPENYECDLIDSDSEKTEEELKELEQEIVTIVLSAVQRTQLGHGNVPNEISRQIEKLINPKLNWKELLFRFVDSKIKEDSSWKRPNHKYLPNFYLPSKQSDKINQLTIAIDTSGSITKELLTEMLTEIQYINETLKPDNLTVLDCDTRINNIYHVKNNDSILEYEFSGGGGTNFEPVIEYCKNNNTNILIYFTDLDARQIQEVQNFHILWVCNSNLPPAIIGETIYVGQ